MLEYRQTQQKKPHTRALRLATAACIGNILAGLGKLCIGIFSASFFTCAGAFYTFGMVAGKFVALAGITRAKSERAQYRYYQISGLILLGTSFLYILYALRLFFQPVNPVYRPSAAIGIAAVTFAEVGLNLRGVLLERHSRAPLMHAVKMLSLAASLICLVLTQSALLSFSAAYSPQIPFANAVMGVLMGCCAASIGIFMAIRGSRRYRADKTHNH